MTKSVVGLNKQTQSMSTFEKTVPLRGTFYKSP
jgi:hypothetical protein